MNLRQTETLQIELAPAKLNLYLDVLGRRDDGFHELEMLLVPLRLYDSLSMRALRPDDHDLGPIHFYVRDERHSDGKLEKAEAVPEDSGNLVVRALRLLRERAGLPFGAKVELIKRIPMAAGLGGGSSDAAATLRLANRAWGLHWSREQLAPLAAELGSDVPFFLEEGAAICRGRGERTERLLPIQPLHVVIVKPLAGLGTADVYLEFSKSPSIEASREGGVASLARSLQRGNLIGAGQQMVNRLQAAAARLSPWVDRLRTAFARLDFAGHQLSGSGTSYFGVCRHAQHARRLATILRTEQLGLVYVTRSCC